MVLFVLVLLVGQLLNLSLRLAQSLLGVIAASTLRVQFTFQFSDSGVHLGHGLAPSLQCVLLSLVKTALHVLSLSLHQLTVMLKDLSSLLFLAQLLSKAGSINHGSLGLVLR